MPWRPTTIVGRVIPFGVLLPKGGELGICLRSCVGVCVGVFVFVSRVRGVRSFLFAFFRL